MQDNMERGGAARMSFMIPLLFFVLFFVLCCGILASVFVKAADETARAEQFDAGVQLCRNEAEILRASRDTAGDCVLYFDADHAQTDKDGAEYYLVVTETLTPQTVGAMRENVISAFSMTGEQLYSLNVSVYLPEGR